MRRFDLQLRSVPSRCIAVTIVILFAAHHEALAEPVVDLSWSFCTGTVLTSRAIGPGDMAGVYSTVRGHQAPHQGYRLTWIVRTPGPGFPDAWRFDAAGCQGTEFITINPRGPVTFTK